MRNFKCLLEKKHGFDRHELPKASCPQFVDSIFRIQIFASWLPFVFFDEHPLVGLL